MPPIDAYIQTKAVLQERDQMIMDVLPQVYYIAARIRERLPQHIEMEDLVNAGLVGLLEAYQNYDSSKSTQFNTFAKFRIRGAILDSLRDLDWGSRPLRRKGRQVDEAILKLEAKLGRQPNETEIAKELQIDVAQLHKLLGQLNGLNLINQQVTATYDGEETKDLVESAPSQGDDNPFNLCLDREIRQHLAEAIAQLPEREQLLISLYYREELTMKEVAAVLNVAESRVSQMHSVIMAKLRATLRHLQGCSTAVQNRGGKW